MARKKAHDDTVAMSEPPDPSRDPPGELKYVRFGMPAGGRMKRPAAADLLDSFLRLRSRNEYLK